MGGHPRAIEALVQAATSYPQLLDKFEEIIGKVLRNLDQSYGAWLNSVGTP